MRACNAFTVILLRQSWVRLRLPRTKR